MALKNAGRPNPFLVLELLAIGLALAGASLAAWFSSVEPVNHPAVVVFAATAFFGCVAAALAGSLQKKK
jgi:hypothetical protein